MLEHFFNVVGCTVLGGTVVSAFVFLLAAIGSMGTMCCTFKCYKLGIFVQAAWELWSAVFTLFIKLTASQGKSITYNHMYITG